MSRNLSFPSSCTEVVVVHSFFLFSDQIVNKNGELVLYSGDSYNKLHEDEIGELEEKVKREEANQPSFEESFSFPFRSNEQLVPFLSFPKTKATRLATELEECRQKVPAQIVEKLHNHLRTLRPSTDIGDATGIKENHTEDSEDVDGLKIKLSTTSRKLPEVRAKIEEAVARTERVIEAIEEQASKSDADFSIEKLLEETAEEDEDEVQDEDDASESKISPELKKAEIAGHVSVRKKWVNMMSCPSPLKFSLKDAR